MNQIEDAIRAVTEDGGVPHLQDDRRRRLWDQAHDNPDTYLRLLYQQGELRLRTLRLDDEPLS